MTTGTDRVSERLSLAILWTLRVTVALQCIGNWRWLTQLEETPLLHWMLDPTDIGGLAWSESTALAVQQVVGWSVLVAAGLVLWRPHAAVLGPLAVLQALITVAMWRIVDGYALQASSISPHLLMLFPFATQLGRVAAPLGLLLLEQSTQRAQGEQAVLWALGMRILRWSISIVFLAHGLEAWQQNPRFLDLLINSTQRLFGLSLSQSTAEQCLAAIGTVDIVLAVACVSFRSLSVLWWMAFWGATTTLSRIVAYGWAVSWHETLTRSAHFGIPLAVVLWCHLLEYRAKMSRDHSIECGQSRDTFGE